MSLFSAETIAQWQTVTSRVYVPLRCRPVSDEFAARVHVLQLSPFLSLSRLKTGSVKVQRSASMASKAQEQELLFALQVGASGSVSQCGREAFMNPGDGVLYETTQPYEIDHRMAGQDEVIAKVHRSAIRLPRSTVSEACGKLIGADDPRLRVLSSYLLALYEDAQDMNPRSRFEMAAVCVDLLETLLRPGLATAGATLGKEQLLEQLQAHIHDYLHRPQLSVETLARHHHVSVRAVYQAFEVTGEPPASYIRRLRLRRAASLLPDAAAGTRTIGSIASESGFHDASAFARAFKHSYGQTPSSWTTHMTGR
ncbi:helix-turn-helix domain-containing protein [Brevibacterium sp. UCMA 11754]|uniref:helix-turn-helix domain-containing protein n=1 Tax=Brevibacterium sp. UCMA 11754 TaxID=2749198 RepID=UPI001F375911|nr:helix-turn-helix domain-containing protein [Brevibacterium sp. UCMA 11754]MCF2574481.1 helix-turn-helix domain-containing protein [Brevibacterium sp. UCMA 11754]